MANDVWPWIELVISESGLPTLMPRWQDLEASSLPFSLLEDSGRMESSGFSGLATSERTLVIIHAYEPDLVDGLLRRFEKCELLCDLVITTDTQEKAHQIESLHLNILGASSRLQVEVMANHGRDVLPFWRVLERYGPDYDFFLKLHLKRSMHWEDLGYWNSAIEGKDAGSAWNDDCFDCLIPLCNVERRSLLHWMAGHRIGALYPRPHRIVERFAGAVR